MQISNRKNNALNVYHLYRRAIDDTTSKINICSKFSLPVASIRSELGVVISGVILSSHCQWAHAETQTRWLAPAVAAQRVDDSYSD
eukprot:scaffold370992_cov28-Prasinocladus_malaysianus.AAC.2